MDFVIKFTGKYNGAEASIEYDVTNRKLTIDGSYSIEEKNLHEIPITCINRANIKKLSKADLELYKVRKGEYKIVGKNTISKRND